MTKRKVSDIVADFLEAKSIKHVFAISGGASLHLIHSVAENSSIEYICNHHEQASAMCADSYSRITGDIGVVIATSGPGATNLITGLCCSYYDSVPVLAITGQVSTTRMAGDTGVRQVGFQETPIVDICKPITKYAVQLTDPYSIVYELEKAYAIAKSGRPGPVLVDIPDNLQREYIDSEMCRHYKDKYEDTFSRLPSLNESIEFIVDKLKDSRRPVIVAGWGVRIASFERELLNFAEKLDIPIALTWGAADLLPYSHPLYVGTFGTHGQRHANFAVQNADLVISFGSRLDTKSTGSPIKTFARGAVKIVIDVDQSELLKFARFGLYIDRLIKQDLRNASLSNLIEQTKDVQIPIWRSWLGQIQEWKELYDPMDQKKREQLSGNKVDPYVFFTELSRTRAVPTNIFLDTGCSVAWGMQALKLNSNTRVYHDLNNTAMGWALPAAIASAISQPDKETICVTGDGSLMMCLHELAVVKRYGLKISLFILNNNGYSMIQQTQDQWLGSKYEASSCDGGLGFPDYRYLAKSFQFSYHEAQSTSEIVNLFGEISDLRTASLCNIHVSSAMRVIPQVKAGYPNEDLEPLLARDVFRAQMIVDPFVS